MAGENFQTLVATIQNIVTAVNGLTQALRKTLNNVPPDTLLGNTSASDSTLDALTALQASQLLLGAQSEIALTDAATVAWNMALGFNFVLTATAGIGATRALGNPTNAVVGQSGYLRYVQSSGGSNALTYGSQYQAAGGVASLSLTTTASAVNILTYRVLPGPIVLLAVAAGVVH
jgi:hypothetical protein